MYPRIARESHADSTTEGGFRWRGRLTTGASDTYGGYRASGIRGRISDLTWSGTPGWRRSSPRGDAEAWLAAEHRLISMGEWTDPIARRRAEDPMTFGPFAETWLDQHDLKPGTRELYRSLLGQTDPVDLRTPFIGGRHPGNRAHVVWLLRKQDPGVPCSRLPGASRDLGDGGERRADRGQPCRVKGGGTHARVRKVAPATLDQIQALTEAMPARLALAVPLASFCALRFGEMSELRRKDIDLQAGVLRIRRGVVRVGRQGYIVGQPKSVAGIRDVAVPPHLIPMIKAHLKTHVGPARETLILTSPTGDRLGASCLQRPWWKARDKVGRPDLRWHDLRHTGAALAAQTGATVAELMGRLRCAHRTASGRLQSDPCRTRRRRLRPPQVVPKMPCEQDLFFAPCRRESVEIVID